MPNYEDSAELDLVKINGQYWALRSKDADNQINQSADYSYCPNLEPYNVDFIGTVRIPLEYIEEYKNTEVWYC
jgi:hypothetical protein